MGFLDSFLAGAQQAQQRRAYNDYRNFKVLGMLGEERDPMKHKALQQSLYSGGYVGEDDEGRLGVSQEDYVNNTQSAEDRRDFIRGANRYVHDAQDGTQQAGDEQLNSILGNRNAVIDAERRGAVAPQQAQQGYTQFLNTMRERPSALAGKVNPKKPNFLQSIFGGGE